MDELRGFFNSTYRGGLQKFQPNSTHRISPTQSNPAHMGQVESGWTHGFDIFFFFIIKLGRKKLIY